MMDSVPTGEDAAPVLCQKRYGAFKIRDVHRPTTHTIFFLNNSGCKAVAKRQEVAIYEAEQTGSMFLSQAQVRIMLVAVYRNRDTSVPREAIQDEESRQETQDQHQQR